MKMKLIKFVYRILGLSFEKPQLAVIISRNY